MSDFNTYEVEVIVKVRVSAYDLEHAAEVAAEVLLEDKAIVSVRELGKLEHTMSSAILKQYKEAAYLEGAQAACSWLEEVYGEGIQATDAWNAYMTEEENN